MESPENPSSSSDELETPGTSGILGKRRWTRTIVQKAAISKKTKEIAKRKRKNVNIGEKRKIIKRKITPARRKEKKRKKNSKKLKC